MNPLFFNPFIMLALTPLFGAMAAVVTHDGPSPEGAKDIGKPVGEEYRRTLVSGVTRG